MSEFEKALDDVEKAADRVLSPERAIRWAVRLLVLVGSLTAVATVGRIAWKTFSKVEHEAEVEAEVEAQQDAKRAALEADRALRASLSPAWFQGQIDAIAAVGAQETSAQSALDRHLTDVDSRVISRESDRVETARLNGIIMNLQKKRAELILEYNNNARKVDFASPGHLDQ